MKKAKSQSDQPNTKPSSLPLRLVDLSEVPIEDPWKEKNLADQDYTYLLEYLRGKAGSGRIGPDALNNRIIEIYRICYAERSTRPEEIIRKFVSSYPQLALEAPWLRALVQTHAGDRDLRHNGPRNRIFRAIGRGFLKLSNPKTRMHRALKSAGLEAALFARREIIRKDLDAWENSVGREVASEDWKSEKAAEKVSALVTGDLRLKSIERQLTTCLIAGQIYKASNLIAAKVYRVPVRALQSKQS